MSVLLTAAIVLIGLLGVSAGSVGIAELAGRLHRRELTRNLISGIESMLLTVAPERGR